MDRNRYPDNWPEISRRIRDQAGNRCEQCGVANGAWRLIDGAAVFTYEGPKPELCERRRCTRIVLTVAHIDDPDPMNVNPGNLAALCQLCHNRLDMPMRQRNAAETRRKRRMESGQIAMEVIQ